MISIRFFLPGVLLLGSTALYGQNPAPTEPTSPSTMPAAPGETEHRKNVHFRRLDASPKEMETVTFLGVETAPVSKAMIAQLALPDRAGLVVQHVVPKTPAADVLKPYDILLKLDDQILIDQHQLSVLIRNHAAGDEVVVTYMRAGKTGTAKVKLGQHDVPKFSDFQFSFPPGEAFGFVDRGERGEPTDREHVDHMLSMMDQAHRGGPVHVEIEHNRIGDATRAVKINTANGNLVYTDDEGSLELTIKNGQKTLVAKDAKGVQEFAGPATTDEERKRIPEKVRGRLEKLEAMHNVSFRTDGDFEDFESDVARPEGKGVRLLRRHSPEPHVLTI